MFEKFKNERKSPTGGGGGHPFERASLFSKLSFWWLKNLVRIGLSRPIRNSDVYQTLDSHESKRKTDTFLHHWNIHTSKTKHPKLITVFAHVYAAKVLSISLLYTFFSVSIRALQPQFIGDFVANFSSNGNHSSPKSFINEFTGGDQTNSFNALCIVLCSLCSALMNQPFHLFTVKLGMEIRLICCSLVYRKILRIENAHAIPNLNGRVINLMSSDVEILDQSLQHVHSLWKGPIEALVFGYIIYREIGYFGLFGIGFILSLVPMQMWMGRMAGVYRLRTTRCIDERVKFMHEIIRGIKVIKMHTLERVYRAVIEKIRRREMAGVRGTLLVKGILMTFNIVPRFAIFLSLITFLCSGNVFTARQVFIVTTYFNFLYDSMLHHWSTALNSCVETVVGIGRVGEFLLLPEKCASECGGYANIAFDGFIGDVLKPKIADSFISFENCSAFWTNIEHGIRNIQLRIDSSVAVIGEIGAGKSTLLKAIIGDIVPSAGRVHSHGSMSYASPEPWLFNGSIRENIVFTEMFDSNRYAEVLRVCALEEDLKRMPARDGTMVGENGACLSGGQRARVNLARAVYRNADIYLLDDPLSALDSMVGQFVMENCIRHFLRDKLVVLVTHQLQLIHVFSKVIIMENGKVIAEKSAHEIQENPTTAADANDNLHEISLPAAMAATNLRTLSENDEETNIEYVAEGSVRCGVYFTYLKSMGSALIGVVVLTMLALEQIAVGLFDFFVSDWVNWENELVRTHTPQPLGTNATNTALTAEQRMHFYGATPLSELDESDIERERVKNIYFYSGIMLVILYLAAQRLFGFIHLCARTSRRLHSQLLRAVTSTSMHFFDTNDSGRILNRFSKEMNILDVVIPQSFYYTVYFLFQSISTLILISTSNFWLLFLVLLLTGIFYALRFVYIRTARCLKRIEAAAHSPMFSLVNATIGGLTTIQVIPNARGRLYDEFDSLQNRNISAKFLFSALNRALAFWIEFFCLIYMATVIAFFLWMQSNMGGGTVGLAISQIIFLSTMSQWGIKQTADLENHMISVERIREYAKLKPEDSDEHKEIGDWPTRGSIRFANVSLRYDASGKDVLKNVSFTIESKAKIGIVGRTGAGKSSIIQALFRLADIQGNIYIDEIDISTVPIEQLRKSITIIPQDALLFCGTIRDNLDPFHQHNDDDLWQTLREVQLERFVSEESEGLSTQIVDGGANLSLGQRQLFFLARALLKRNKILVLDEATANIDAKTDSIVQQIIRVNFAECTVLTIAHRLHTIIDCDGILAINDGCVAEFDTPANLMDSTDTNGYFKQMNERNAVDELGSHGSSQ